MNIVGPIFRYWILLSKRVSQNNFGHPSWRSTICPGADETIQEDVQMAPQWHEGAKWALLGPGVVGWFKMTRWHQSRRKGKGVEMIPDDPTGRWHLDDLQQESRRLVLGPRGSRDSRGRGKFVAVNLFTGRTNSASLLIISKNLDK